MTLKVRESPESNSSVSDTRRLKAFIQNQRIQMKRLELQLREARRKITDLERQLYKYQAPKH